MLLRGYQAKRSKELTAAQDLFSADAMRDAYAKAEAACERLEVALRRGATHWLLDDAVTMADLYWAVELLRLKNMGAKAFWENGRRPAVADYLDRVAAIPAVRAAVIDWPGALF